MPIRLSAFLKLFGLVVTLTFSGCKSRDVNDSTELKASPGTMDELDSNGCFVNRTGRVIDRSPPLGFANCHDGKVLMLTSEGDFQGVQVAGQDVMQGDAQEVTEVSWEEVSPETSIANMEGGRLVSAELKLHLVIVKGERVNEATKWRVNEATKCLGLVKIIFPTQADKAEGAIYFYKRRNELDREPKEIARFVSCKFENMSTFNRFRDRLLAPR